MLDQSITILKYEYHIAPGSYFHVETPWVKDVSEIKTVIIDQDNVFTKMLSIYPNNFVMFLEQFPEYSARTYSNQRFIPRLFRSSVITTAKKQNLDNLISLRPSSAFSFILLLVRVSGVRLRVLESYFLHVT